MENKNIVFNCTLEQYNKKYRNRRYRLLKYTKKQVEDFDKQYGHYVFNNKTYTLEFNKYLLKDRKWALIGDTYYEIPRPVRYTWFRNLNAACQVGTCVLLAGAVGGGVYGITYAITHSNPIAIVDTSLSEYLKIKKIDNDKDGNTVIHLGVLKPVISKPEVLKGEHKLTEDTEYKYDGKAETGEFEIVVYKEAMDKYPGQIVIKANEITSYNIDWATTKFKIGANEMTLYEFAKVSNEIKFIQDDSVGSLIVGENGDPIYADQYWNTNGLGLKIWSRKKISFKDNDRFIDPESGTKGFFEECHTRGGSTSFDFSNIDMSNVTDFSNCFSGCNKTVELDLSNFNTAKATNMNGMFNNCSQLVTIYTSNKFVTTNVIDSTNMFNNCTAITGGLSTTYDSGHIDKEYARIDGGASKPGYFTEKK